uniref:glycosyltransferase n=1 Tax=Bifidobacterium longum TaxID=216816 RepID=UPI00359CB7DB
MAENISTQSSQRPTVSVVVPIYNVERYLRTCVESLLKQTLNNMEIILVDDGSPDKSGLIADELASLHSNVKAVHQKNAGLGPARNTGIEYAAGEYVGFVDSDDWVDASMFADLYAAAKRDQADIVFGGHKDMVNGNVNNVKPHPLAGKTLNTRTDILGVRERLFGHLPDDSEVESFPMRVWTGIYRNDFLIEHDLRFKPILSEDTIFNLSAYQCAQVITFTGGTAYCYRMDNQPSIMRSFSSKKLNQYAAFLDELFRIAEQDPQCERCVLRARRMAIDYCRLYVGLIAGARLSWRQQLHEVRGLVSSDMFNRYCRNYPMNGLPTQQRMFHEALMSNHLNEALLLLHVRQLLKKRIWK